MYFLQIKETLAHKGAVGSVSTKDLFLRPEYVKPTIIMILLHIFQQTTGVNAVMFYLTNIFIVAETGLSPELQATTVALVQARHPTSQNMASPSWR
jgi:hypothetical protein